MTTISELRQNLVDTLQTVGPGSPTLCEGWSTEHLLAHLYLRESRPDVAAGVAVPALAERTESKTNELADRLSDQAAYGELLATFATAGFVQRKIAALDEGMNFVEYIVHREDVRRGAPEIPAAVEGAAPFREDEQDLVWNKLKKMSLMLSKDYPNGLTLVGTDESGEPTYGEFEARKPAEKSRVSGLVQKVMKSDAKGAPVTVTGEPVEILLYLFGRTGAAKVSL